MQLEYFFLCTRYCWICHASLPCEASSRPAWCLTYGRVQSTTGLIYWPRGSRAHMETTPLSDLNVFKRANVINYIW